MKKLIAIVSSLFLVTTISLKAEMGIGISGAYHMLDGSGTETTRQSGQKNNGSHSEEVLVPELFIEAIGDNGAAFGLSYISTRDLGTKARTDAESPGDTDSDDGTYTAKAEFDEARYPGDYAPSARGYAKSLMDKRGNEHIFSQYFDYQFRPIENLYATVGLRSDEHSIVGRKTSGRTTLAYKLDQKSKIRSSFGAGVRFPSLYDYHFADGNTPSSGGGNESGDGYAGLTLEDLKSERGISYDIGYDTYIDNIDTGLSLTYFNVKQKNPLNSDARNNWKMQTTVGVNTSEGIELSADWKPENKKIGVIKVIREITSVGLKEAKDMADNAPSVIKEQLAKDEAEEAKKKLEEAGATVTLK